MKKLIEKWNREDNDTYHFRMGIVKSMFRITAGVFLITGNIAIAGVLFIVAESFGIAEEL